MAPAAREQPDGGDAGLPPPARDPRAVFPFALDGPARRAVGAVISGDECGRADRTIRLNRIESMRARRDGGWFPQTLSGNIGPRLARAQIMDC
jgi:hypothetical protein